MRKQYSILTTAILLLMSLALAYAQFRGGDSPRNRLRERFAASELRVGDPLPAIECFDGKGAPFNLGNLKGRYAVVVFGCLT